MEVVPTVMAAVRIEGRRSRRTSRSEVPKEGRKQIQHSMTSMGQMMPKQHLIIIIWTHQEMIAWMSRKSIGILDVFMGDFGSKLGKLGRI
jgi:hypothetical protein